MSNFMYTGGRETGWCTIMLMKNKGLQGVNRLSGPYQKCKGFRTGVEEWTFGSPASFPIAGNFREIDQ